MVLRTPYQSISFVLKSKFKVGDKVKINSNFIRFTLIGKIISIEKDRNFDDLCVVEWQQKNGETSKERWHPKERWHYTNLVLVKPFDPDVVCKKTK